MTRAGLAPGATHHMRRLPGANPFSLLYAEMDWVSTRTPTPMVEETATLRRYTPLLEAGFALFSASIKAAKLP